MVTKEKLTEALEQLVGEPFYGHSIGCDVFYCIKLVLDAEGISVFDRPNNKYFSYDTDRQFVKITYDGNTLMEVSVKKKRGKSYHFFCSTSYDWTISDISVVLYGNTVEERMNEIEDMDTAQQKAKAVREAELAKIVKTFMAQTGKTFREAMRIVEELYNKRYSSEFEKKCLQDNNTTV